MFTREWTLGSLATSHRQGGEAGQQQAESEGLNEDWLPFQDILIGNYPLVMSK